jgi:hypothetical protein
MTASDTRRVEWRGGGHWYRLDGEKVDGVTTVLNQGIPKAALVPWAAKVCAETVVDKWDALADMQPDERIDFIKGAPSRDRDRGARRGTEVHGYAEQIIEGAEVDVPDELLGHVDSYIKFLKDFDVQPVLVEAVVGNRAHKWMGTIDGVFDFNDGLRRLCDIKTTRSGVFPETAIQIAAYKNAEFYLDAYGREHSMIPVDACAAIWVRADGYSVIPVDAGPDTYRVFRHAQQIARFQTVTSKTVIGEELLPPRDNAE